MRRLSASPVLLALALGALLPQCAVAEVVLVDPEPTQAYARAGLRDGDVLLGWRLESPRRPIAAEGTFESVFDVWVVSTEYSPRGTIAVRFRRDGVVDEVRMPRARSWTGDLRPDWDAATNDGYRAALQMIAGGDAAAGVERLEALAAGRHDPLESAWLLHRAGEALRKSGDLEAAAAVTDRAIAAAELGGHPAGAAFIVSSAAVDLFQSGHPDAGTGLLEDTLRRQEAIEPKSLSVARALGNLAIGAANQSRFDASRDYARRALALREALAPGSLVEAEALHTLGNVAFWTDDLEAAAGLYERALAIRELEDPGGLTVARNLSVLSNVAWRRGRLREADALLERAAALYRQNDANDGYLGELSITLGHIAHDRGHYSQAERHYLKGLALMEGFAPGTRSHADVLHALGVNAAARLDDETARVYEARALAIYEQLQPHGQRVALVLTHLGRIAMRNGELDLAERHFQESLAIAEAFGTQGFLLASRLANFGDLERERGRAAEAAARYRRALEILETSAPESLFVADALTRLGGLGRETGEPQAEAHLRRALALARDLGPGTMFVARPAYELALLLRDRGETDEALAHFELAVDALEAQRDLIGGSDEVRSRYGAFHRQYYRDYIDLLERTGRTEGAFYLLERYRARGLLLMLSQHDFSFEGVDLPGPLVEERQRLDREYGLTYRRYRELDPDTDAAALAPILERLSALRTERGELAGRIRAVSPLLAALEHPRSLDADGASGALDAGTLLLSYLVLDERTLVFVLRAGAGTVHVLETPLGREQVAAKVRRMRVLLRVPLAGEESTAALAELGAELYAALVQPALELMPDASRLLIVADGPLHLLPFAALSRRSSPGERPRFLIEDYALQMSASATVSAEQRKRPPAAPRIELAAFGAPVYPDNAAHDGGALLRGRSLSPLPGSGLEVRGIAALFGSDARSYLGPRASEEQLKSIGAEARLLHFAVHGVLDARSPLDSFVALSSPPAEAPENGLLQAWEIIEQLRLDADLVVLSACDTALGEEAGGEGLLGLTRAFQLAGARNVVASLWQVPDRSTGALMTRFYRHLKAGAREDDALRAAQLELLHGPVELADDDRWWAKLRRGVFGGPVMDVSHPYYWAAFQLHGAAGSR